MLTYCIQVLIGFQFLKMQRGYAPVKVNPELPAPHHPGIKVGNGSEYCTKIDKCPTIWRNILWTTAHNVPPSSCPVGFEQIPTNAPHPPRQEWQTKQMPHILGAQRAANEVITPHQSPTYAGLGFTPTGALISQKEILWNEVRNGNNAIDTSDAC